LRRLAASLRHLRLGLQVPGDAIGRRTLGETVRRRDLAPARRAVMGYRAIAFDAPLVAHRHGRSREAEAVEPAQRGIIEDLVRVGSGDDGEAEGAVDAV